MNQELSMITAASLSLPADFCRLAPEAQTAKELALSESALFGKVTTKMENDLAGQALGRLQALSRALESQRKKITDPFLEAQRYVKRLVDEFKDEIDQESARVELLMKDFALAERSRAREEVELQQRELDRIERERQAALATAKTEDEKAAIEDKADLTARIAAKPVEIARSAGQTTRKIWKITQINDFQLVKARPDLVRRIEWDKVAITEILNTGGKLPGVTAEEDLTIHVRRNAVKTIEI